MTKSSYSWFVAIIGAALLTYALLVPALNPAAVNTVNLASVYQPPSPSHWFGTDQLGRDLWSRTAAALRVSLVMAIGAAVFSTLLGILAAVVAVTSGKWADRIITRLIDVLNAIPHLLLSVVILALWPGQIWAIVLSIALTHWTQTARLLRAKLLSERERGFVQLSLSTGARPLALWRTHLIPAVLPQATIAFALQIPHAMWHESALSFLGVGLPAQSASLGLLLEDARSGILSGAWWLLVFPSIALILASWTATTGSHHLHEPKQGARHKAPAALSNESSGQFQKQISAPGLQITASVTAGTSHLVHSASLCASPGTIHALTGESGAGKTVFLRAIAGLLPENLEASSRLTFHGKSYKNAAEGKLLGKELVFIPGSAATALNPVRTLRSALKRTFRQQLRPTSNPDLIGYWQGFGLEPHLLDLYPHQLSGGQAQRAVLALGLVSEPKCILLDEPTSALDNTTRTIVADILRGAAQRGAIVLIVTHDHDLAENMADVLHVMDHGQLVTIQADSVGAKR